jgi:hypothetical protein
MEKPSPVRAILRRSNISASAPAGRATNINGSIIADCTSATMLGEFDSRVISQAAPTPRISWPKLENRLAVQIRRKVGSRSGAVADDLPFSVGAILAAIYQSLREHALRQTLPPASSAPPIECLAFAQTVPRLCDSNCNSRRCLA